MPKLDKANKFFAIFAITYHWSLEQSKHTCAITEESSRVIFRILLNIYDGIFWQNIQS